MPDFSHLKGRNWIYVIKDLGGDPERTRLDYDQLRPDRKLNPMFLARRNSVPGNILYVGSTRTSGIARRLGQHVHSTAQAKTYALKLNLWFKGEYEISLRQYDLVPPKLPVGMDPALVLQIIEDSIADELKPAYGKRGANAHG